MPERKLGRLPARHDARVPLFSKHAPSLPPPPRAVNWYADIPEWGMLGNDSVGDCVVAWILHSVMQCSAYINPGAGLIATEAEAIAFYEKLGYVPGVASTDQGAYVLGSGGAIDTWVKQGIVCGGVLIRPTAVMNVGATNPIQWRQAIALFGSVGFGIDLPQSVVDSEPPFVWSNFRGPVAGGHQVICVGYDVGIDRYTIVSWGTLYRCSERFLLNVVKEAVAILDPEFISAQNISPGGLRIAELVADTKALGVVVA